MNKPERKYFVVNRDCVVEDYYTEKNGKICHEYYLLGNAEKRSHKGKFYIYKCFVDGRVYADEFENFLENKYGYQWFYEPHKEDIITEIEKDFLFFDSDKIKKQEIPKELLTAENLYTKVPERILIGELWSLAGKVSYTPDENKLSLSKNNRELVISTSSPGRWIGKKGANVKKLQEVFDFKISIKPL